MNNRYWERQTGLSDNYSRVRKDGFESEKRLREYILNSIRESEFCNTVRLCYGKELKNYKELYEDGDFNDTDMAIIDNKSNKILIVISSKNSLSDDHGCACRSIAKHLRQYGIRLIIVTADSKGLFRNINKRKKQPKYHASFVKNDILVYIDKDKVCMKYESHTLNKNRLLCSKDYIYDSHFRNINHLKDDLVELLRKHTLHSVHQLKIEEFFEF